jgi:DNA-binding CsgD family transcriptional regulator
MRLTDKESVIMSLVSIGKTNKEIGAGLVMTENTVKHHLTIIYIKLSVNDRKGALDKINGFSNFK